MILTNTFSDTLLQGINNLRFNLVIRYVKFEKLLQLVEPTQNTTYARQHSEATKKVNLSIRHSKSILARNQ